jgi:hypothetical protein
LILVDLQTGRESAVRRASIALMLVLALAPGCTRESGTPVQRPPSDTPAGFVDTEWQVSASPTVEVGSTYTFRADGTLLLTSPHGAPATGSWRREGEGLVVVEEGIEYPAEIVALTSDRFELRIHGPGDAVELTLVPVTSAH